ncbi:peptidoglycan endopeptidase [Pseudomonas gingeri NCPPB 3146 = LMG 5327]|uniref:C40 family peptidase n=2 Tax=Pseudomonas gingeri TaxID=117681 RepID=A0A7Y7Y3K5_9PSED|nr:MULTISPECIES: C40 family peptidase [Pseudomonas]NVZ26003.1 C40 family peptidase [Pseudomonas gingeri]NVZ60992.1 C40 family peptidase [Pseudomonas gingeri]NVZ75745.1 C40 family peptidase [Pseudomonas gingeri]NWC17253.1 C40 family peptidase [Pseudomonas gingeri]NWE48822.1 C40 family peptidase [Pseudomonas gingeri]
MSRSVLVVLLLMVLGSFGSAHATLKSAKNSSARTTQVPATGGAAESSIDNVIDRAHQLIGTPYRWGGMSVKGFDCSGLLVYLFQNEADIKLPRTTVGMRRSSARTIQRGSLQPGDAVFFNRNGQGSVSHVGLYVGGGKFIHSPRSGKTVRIDSLSNSYWKKSYTLAKRFHSES